MPKLQSPCGRRGEPEHFVPILLSLRMKALDSARRYFNAGK